MVSSGTKGASLVTYEVFPLALGSAMNSTHEAHLKADDRDLDVLAPEERPEPFEEPTEHGHLSGAS